MMGTIFSEDRLYRYTLSRKWVPDVAPRFINFILLNPSTADETQDDPTIRRCIGFAKREGFGAMVVTNIFAFRATKPHDLMKALDPIGLANDSYLLEVAQLAGGVILGWGNHGAFKGRDIHVFTLLGGNSVHPYVLGWTKAMQPKHPLYLRNDAPLQVVKLRAGK